MDEKSVENLVAAVEHGSDRISHISIENVNGSAIGKLAAALQHPLPTLNSFFLISDGDSAPELPETFLGGSAPDLEYFELSGIQFPTFPEFILSFTHVRYLHISEIQYISPNTLAVCLAALPNLENLYISFTSGPCQVTPPRTRIALPALTKLSFTVISQYFEDFVAQIDTPLLYEFNVCFIMDVTLFTDVILEYLDVPQFRQFIGHAERLKPLGQAVVEFHDQGISISDSDGPGFPYRFKIRGDMPHWRPYMHSMAQTFRQQLSFLSHVEQLVIVIAEGCPSHLEWLDDSDVHSWKPPALVPTHNPT